MSPRLRLVLGACIALAVALLPGGHDAAAQNRLPAADMGASPSSDATPAPSRPVVVTPSDMASAGEDEEEPASSADPGTRLFQDRVTGLKNFATSLKHACTQSQPALSRQGAILRDAIQRSIDELHGGAAKDLQEKKAQIESRKRELDQDKVRLEREKWTLGPAETQKKNEIDAQIRDILKIQNDDAQRLAADEAALAGARKTAAADAMQRAQQMSGALSRLLTPGAGMCKELCGSPQAAASYVDLCAFSSLTLASAAVMADWGSVLALAGHTHRTIEQVDVELYKDHRGSLSELQRLTRDLGERLPAAAVLAKANDLAGVRHGFEVDLATVSMRTLDLGLHALAKVIEDRAKREGLVWFLQRLHDGVCDPKDDISSAPAEIRTYWLPSMCALAQRTEEYLQYGGGGELLRALQGAIASDVKRWPGASVGLGMSLRFWNDTPAEARHELASLLSCSKSTHEDKGICPRARRLRSATAKLIGAILAGENGAASLFEYAGEIDFLNRDGKQFYSGTLQLSACVTSIPLLFQEYGDAVETLKLGRFAGAEALLLGAIAAAPACFSIAGRGWPAEQCPAFDPAGDLSASICNPGATQTGAAGETKRIERLTTIVRWAKHTGMLARHVVTRLGTLNKAWERYEQAIAAFKASGGGTFITPPSFDVGAVSDPKSFAEALRALQDYVRNTARTAQHMKQAELLQAAVALGHASVDLGLSVTAAGREVGMPDLYPALCPSPESCDLSLHFAKTQQTLAYLSDELGMVESALNQDWGPVVAHVIAGMRAEIEPACKNDAQCARLADVLSRYAGVFAALASETDPDRVAAALDAAAMPIGGWRRKSIPGALTLSIAAFPGFSTAAEWRWGQYGVRSEHGKPAHFAAPTLTLPVGLDFAYGRHTKVFVSVLDPAAYLQYDVEAQGRLPGAQILTVLAPGIAYRFAPWDAPFSVNAFAVYRPALRAWQSSASGPAADAFQLGAGVSVDVTLFELHTSEPGVAAGP